MMKIICELLLFTKFVSMSVIPPTAKFEAESTRGYKDNVEDTLEASPTKPRQKRDLFLQGEYMDNDVDNWEPVCPVNVEIEPLAAMRDSQGAPVFHTSNQFPNSDYRHMIKTQRCRHSDATIGGVRMTCEQMYLEQKVYVFDRNSEEKLYERTEFIPSGCRAKFKTSRYQMEV